MEGNNINNLSSSDLNEGAARDVSGGVSPVVETEEIQSESPSILAKIKPFYKQHKKYLLLISAILLIAVGLLALLGQQEHRAIKNFTHVYSFVPEKISKSAAIQINLPEGVDESLAQSSITFSPEVEGNWKIEDLDKVVIFEPKKPLKSGVYYAVNMDTGSVQMSGDFYVDEDPKIEAIFPSAGSESHEDSEITIVFNRPMVPLTTLTVLDSIELPITITPETPGKFKWISTRNLQFIPETTLRPSSDYRVEIKSGMFSMDGLPIAPVTHDFFTRPLRYEHVSSDQIGYRAPIIIGFNQPVDIDKTKKQISVSRQEGGEVNVEVEYGEITYYDYSSRKYITEADPSKLFVYQKKDSHGRKRLWDFDTTYKIAISGAVPLAGTKNLNEGNLSFVTIPNIVEQVSAQSERTSLARQDFFDPAGTLTVTFYDEVDKDSSKISVKGLKEIKYGERCRVDESGEPISLGSGCEKEADTRTLIFSFNPGVFKAGESFSLDLSKIYTKEDFLINTSPISLQLVTYPEFKILSTNPNNQSTGGSLNGMYVCSNSPLRDPGEDSVRYINTSGYIVYGRWSPSWYVSQNYGNYNGCPVGEFETRLNYGLLPETNYTLDLNLIDVFDQKESRQLNFKTEPAKEQYTRFHNMQKQYNVTTPDKTKLTYAVENLEFVDMHICKMGPEVFLKKTINQPSQNTAPSNGDCLEVVTDKKVLPARYWVNNYFQINLADFFTDTRGHYIITFSNPLYVDSYYKKQLYDRTYVSVTNLAVGKKETEYSENNWSYSTNPFKDKVLEQKLNVANNLYWVNLSQSLIPATGALVTQYSGSYKNSDEYEFSGQTYGSTNIEGIAKLGVSKGVLGAVVKFGNDTAVITDWADTLRGAGTVSDASRTYIYTDRPIYRPGQTVYVRGIDRIGFDGAYEIWNKDSAKLEMFDSRGTRIYETLLEQSEYGTFNTEFELPENTPLGTYRIEVFGRGAWFSVEEYVPAAFKLEAVSDKEEYVNGDTIKLDVQADYYFGVPVSEGKVSYSVTAQDYYFDRYQDEYFNFGNDWYYCYDCWYGDEFLFRGETNVNDKGGATIEKQINFKDYFDDIEDVGSKLVTVSVTVKDQNGRAVSMQKSFIVHKGDYYIGAKTDQYYTGINSPITLRVKTVNQQGEGMSLVGISRTLYKVDWETFKRQEVDGGFYYRSEKTLKEVGSEKIKTDENGDWSGGVSFSEEGQYEIHVFKEDTRGNKIKTVSNVYIYGAKSISIPPNNNYELDLEVDQTNLEIGDKATLLIKSPYNKAKALISVERGTVYDYWVVDLSSNLYVHEFPIKGEYAPNIFVSVLLLSPDPEVKYGSVRYEIGTKEKQLSIDVKSNKTHYLPGEEVTLEIETRDDKGRTIPAEVSIAVADLSVLALKGNPKKNPTVFFYDGFPLSVTTGSNIKNILYEVDVPLGTKGGGGSDPEDLAKKKRGVFKDTAFWEASVKTDQNGKATVSFILPDNLTTWQIESLGVTKDTKLGVDYKEFTTKKELMAVPLKPRFVIPGDTFYLGAKVFNQTEKNSTITVKLESDTLVFKDRKEESISIAKGESKTVYFEVAAPGDKRAGTHDFTFTAEGDGLLDVVEQVITITPNTTYETVATANFTKEDRASEYLYIPDNIINGEGGLTINANATMAVFMTDALTYMVTYPYGCSEQLSSSLSTIGILTSALSLPNVEGELDTITHEGVVYSVDVVVAKGLGQIYETQTSGGGFAYYKGLQPNLELTMHVVTALNNLKKAGYEVREDVILRSLAYIETEAKRMYSSYPAVYQETVVLAEYVIRSVDDSRKTSLATIVETLIADKAFLNEKISSMTLAYLAILTADNFSRSSKNRVYEALTNRIDIDGRGAYLKTFSTTNYNYYETPIKNTALLLKAFSAHKDENPAMANALRWLLAGRDKDGAWGGTHNTFVVVDAMVDYLKWQKETESHFTLKGILDGVEVFGYEFSPSNIFKTFTHKIPISQLAQEKLIPMTFSRESHNGRKNNFYYDMTLKYFLPVESLPPRDEGITIERGLYELSDRKHQSPVTRVASGELLRGKLKITIPANYANVAIEDIIPAGFEIVNFNLETEDKSLQNEEYYGMVDAEKSGGWLSKLNIFRSSQTAQVYQDRGFGGSYGNSVRKLYPTHTEAHDDRVFLYVESLAPGVYEYEYYLRALIPGTYQHLPARAEELFFPEVFGRTAGNIIEVTKAK